MDRAVLDACNWTNIQPRCEFILDYEDEEDDNPGKPSKKRKPYRYRWPDGIRDDVLGRLLELNAAMAEAEEPAGPAKGQSEGRTQKAQKSPRVMPLLE